jgi:hypothetical protein
VKEVGTPDPSQTKVPSVMLSDPPSQSGMSNGCEKNKKNYSYKNLVKKNVKNAKTVKKM